MSESASIVGEEPLVLVECQCSYGELVRLVSQLPVSRQNNQVLPPEILRRIANFLTLDPVQPSEVVAVRSSSSDPLHALSCSLEESYTSWWISCLNTMPRGKGAEYVEFQLAPNKLRRLRRFSIEIPPLPMGPMSVRELRLDRLVCRSRRDDGEDDDVWVPIQWARIENKTGWQTFALIEPVDAEFIRVVCLTNQISSFLPDPEAEDYDSDADPRTSQRYSRVGFYHVKFE